MRQEITDLSDSVNTNKEQAGAAVDDLKEPEPSPGLYLGMIRSSGSGKNPGGSAGETPSS